MELTLIRTSRQEGFTTGVLCQGKQVMGYTLEPQWRDLSREKQVRGHTAIPEGTYHVTLSWSPRFRRMVPRLEKVPYFTGILIHCGNKVGDTRGCILVGERNAYNTLKNSRVTFDRLYACLEAAVKVGEEVTITVE